MQWLCIKNSSEINLRVAFRLYICSGSVLRIRLNIIYFSPAIHMSRVISTKPTPFPSVLYCWHTYIQHKEKIYILIHTQSIVVIHYYIHSNHHSKKRRNCISRKKNIIIINSLLLLLYTTTKIINIYFKLPIISSLLFSTEMFPSSFSSFFVLSFSPLFMLWWAYWTDSTILPALYSMTPMNIP